MRRMPVSIVGVAAPLALASVVLACSSPTAADLPSDWFEIGIDVAPSVVALDSQGQVVTVHADINYGAVDAWSVQLDGLPIESWKADDQGNFVAKFNLDDVKDMIEVGTVTLTLTGATRDGEAFSGSDTIRVI